jgi:hypothetical protein
MSSTQSQFTQQQSEWVQTAHGRWIRRIQPTAVPAAVPTPVPTATASAASTAETVISLPSTVGNKVVSFGSYRGMTYAQVLEVNPEYPKWCCEYMLLKNPMFRFVSDIASLTQPAP